MAGYTGAFVIKDAMVKFGATDYAAQCTRVRLVPDTPVQRMRTLVPDGEIVDVDSPSWTLELSGPQDWESGGLADYFRDNAGQLVTFVVAPRKGTGKQQATGSVRVFHVPFGGDQGSFATFEVEFPVDGQPTFASQA